MQAQQLHTLRKNQISLELAGTVANIIGPVEITRPIVTAFNGSKITHFPVDTSDAEIRTVARILQGIVRYELVKVTYVFRGNYDYGLLGELIAIPGVVKDNVILAVYPEFKGNYDPAMYELVQQGAKLLGGRMENIIYRTYYEM